MKFGPVRKSDKKNTTTSKKFGEGAMQKNCDVIVFSQFEANLQPSRSQILNA